MLTTIQRSDGTRVIRFVLALLGALALLPPALFAGGNWVNSSGGKWETGSNWNGGTAPGSADAVAVTINGPYSVTVDDATMSSGKTNFWTFGLTGTTVAPQLVLNFGSGTFADANWMILGNVGAANQPGYGTLIVSNGTVTTGLGLYVGYGTGSHGTVDLYGGHLVASGNLYVGDSGGNGNVLASGGALIDANVYLSGIDAGAGQGTLTLSNATIHGGTIAVGHLATSTGTLNVTGGYNVLGGVGGTGSWNFNVADGGSLSAGSVSVTRGTLVFTNAMGAYGPSIGVSGTGTLTIQGGEVDVLSGNGINLGAYGSSASGSGYLNMNSGTLNVPGGSLAVGQNAAAGTMIMSNGTVTTYSLGVGGSGAAATFKMYGGSLTILPNGPYPEMIFENPIGGSPVSVLIDGGLLDASAALYDGLAYSPGYAGSMTISNGTALWGGAFTTTGTTRLSVFGGTNVFGPASAGTTYFSYGFGNYANSTGAIVVANSGVLEFGPKFSYSIGAILGNGGNGLGTITNMTGGTIRFDVNNPLFTVSGGGSAFVVTNATIEYYGNNHATVAPGFITYQGDNTLRLNSSTNASPGAMTFAAGGSQNYANLQLVNGSTRWNGTALTVGSGGSLLVSSTTATIGGVFTNAGGTVTFANANATFEGKVYNNGGWISDPSTITYLSDYAVGTGGTLFMAAGDVYIFKSNFVNQSTQNTTYNTLAGKFLFNGGALTQTFASAAADLGPGGIYSSYPGRTNTLPGTEWGTGPTANNFGLGTLEIGPGSTVEVANATANLRGALYLDNLFIDAGGLLIVSNNVSVYYMGANGWSFANNVTLLTGAELHELVPEPSTVLLLGLGGLVAWGRTRRWLTRG